MYVQVIALIQGKNVAILKVSVGPGTLVDILEIRKFVFLCRGAYPELSSP
jgi:hypothetical protein